MDISRALPPDLLRNAQTFTDNLEVTLMGSVFDPEAPVLEGFKYAFACAWVRLGWKIPGPVGQRLSSYGYRVAERFGESYETLPVFIVADALSMSMLTLVPEEDVA